MKNKNIIELKGEEFNLHIRNIQSRVEDLGLGKVKKICKIKCVEFTHYDNPCRPTGYDNNTVQEINKKKKDGLWDTTKYPLPVACYNDDGILELICGMHRLKSAFECDEEYFEVVIVEFNSKEKLRNFQLFENDESYDGYIKNTQTTKDFVKTIAAMVQSGELPLKGIRKFIEDGPVYAMQRGSKTDFVTKCCNMISEYLPDSDSNQDLNAIVPHKGNDLKKIAEKIVPGSTIPEKSNKKDPNHKSYDPTLKINNVVVQAFDNHKSEDKKCEFDVMYRLIKSIWYQIKIGTPIEDINVKCLFSTTNKNDCKQLKEMMNYKNRFLGSEFMNTYNKLKDIENFLSKNNNTHDLHDFIDMGWVEQNGKKLKKPNALKNNIKKHLKNKSNIHPESLTFKQRENKCK